MLSLKLFVILHYMFIYHFWYLVSLCYIILFYKKYLNHFIAHLRIEVISVDIRRICIYYNIFFALIKIIYLMFSVKILNIQNDINKRQPYQLILHENM